MDAERPVSLTEAIELEIAHLRVAVASRTVIGQAQGVLMERYGLGPDEAFAVLRRYSQDRNIKLVDIAREIVERRGVRLVGLAG